MKRSPKAIGTHAESAVVSYLRSAGFPGAERAALAGTGDRGDITGTPGLVWEVKAGEVARRAQDASVTRWLAETERERRNASADVGILVMVRPGHGEARAGSWWALLSLHGAATLLLGERQLGPPLWTGTPVWLTLDAACRLAVGAGYGEQVLELGGDLEGAPSS